jgi:hypothetical protein
MPQAFNLELLLPGRDSKERERACARSSWSEWPHRSPGAYKRIASARSASRARVSPTHSPAVHIGHAVEGSWRGGSDSTILQQTHASLTTHLLWRTSRTRATSMNRLLSGCEPGTVNGKVGGDLLPIMLPHNTHHHIHPPIPRGDPHPNLGEGLGRVVCVGYSPVNLVLC